MGEVVRRVGSLRGVDKSTGADPFYMGRAIELAWLGAGRTQSNPMVGAVVVRDGQIVGEGCHERYGSDHAEVVALDNAGDLARGGTLYCTLEPCAHHGKTPPCVHRIVASGVERVVASTRDPNGRVNGRGFDALRQHGITVEVGCLAGEAVLLNIAYFKKALTMGPSVTLKMAVTLDGKIASAPGGRDAITGRAVQEFVHRLRAAHDGVLVGIGTILVDRPQLDCRFEEGLVAPVPVVLDTRLRFPKAYRWLDERRRFVVVSGSSADDRRAKTLRAAGASVIQLATADGAIDPKEAVAALAREGIESLLVEGGAAVFSSFVAAGSWDALYVFTSPVMFGPDGVDLASGPVTRERLDGIPVGAATIGGDTIMKFVKQSVFDEMITRLI